MSGKKEHGGNLTKIRRQVGSDSLIDFSANINPLGPPEWLRPLISCEIENIVNYPDPDCFDLCSAIAEYHQIEIDNIIAGNGTSELLYYLFKIIDCNRVVIPVPSYVDYQHSASVAGCEIVNFQLIQEENFEIDFDKLGATLLDGDVVVLGVPNNPTGVLPDFKKLKEIIELRPKVTFILDEAFLSFIVDIKSFACSFVNVITLNSMTKLFAVPGVRLGYLTAPKEIIRKFKNQIPPWSVNSFAQKIGVKALQDESYKQETLEYVRRAKFDFYEKLAQFPEISVFNSSVNFFLCKLKVSLNCFELRDKLLDKGFVIRPCANYEVLDESYFRIAVKTVEENNSFIEALGSVFRKKVKNNKSITPALMVQGTCSNAGKSILTAALCRIFLQDGVSVAPFKAQNMSLNSYVTLDGGEMGRAQVVQAQAAKLSPDWRMNPVLLKPNSDTGSQVIVHGKPVGNMSVREYHKYKPIAWSKITQAYDELAGKHELILLEGAGSPGEVNLKKHDVVNMKMAEYAGSPVLLVGDIDRGGVYSSFVGIMEVLAEWERKLVCGYVVNKFRGDKSLLASAHQYVKEHTGKEVFGVVPHLENLGIPEEDSVSFKLGGYDREKPNCEYVIVGVVNLPHISNFTDFEPFLEEPDVYLKIINQADEISGCDALIIPGSKNVLGDLDYLKSGDLQNAILKFAENEGVLVGICGGYQILGREIVDKHGVESSSCSTAGLCLLDIQTEMAVDKTLTRKSGKHLLSDNLVYGYEIHHGLTQGNQNHIFSFDDSSLCGSSSNGQLIWGAYLHGMFDADDFRRWFIDSLRLKKGYTAIGTILYHYDLEREFDKLAETVRESLDMGRIYQQLKL